MKIRKFLGIGIALSLPLLMVGCSSTNKGNESNLESTNNSEEIAENIEENTSNKEQESENNTSSEISESNMVLYTYSVDDDFLVSKTMPMSNIDVHTVFSALKENGVVKKDAKILNYSVKEDEFGKTGLLNLSKEYYNYNLGSTISSGMLNALAQTMLANLDIDKLQILIDGEFYEDGHILLDDSFYFTKTSVGSVDEDLPAN